MDRPSCTFALTDVWYRALLDDGVVFTAGASIGLKVDTVQLIDIPDQSECGLIVGGWDRVQTSSVFLTAFIYEL
jgi:hypothetical protein